MTRKIYVLITLLIIVACKKPPVEKSAILNPTLKEETHNTDNKTYITDIFKNLSNVDSIYNTSLTLRVFKGENSVRENNNPCVLFLSGGGWENFSWTQMDVLKFGLLNLGITPIVVEYRTVNEHGDVTPFDALADVKDAICFIRNNASKYNINPDQIIALGTSSGGHLAFSSYINGSMEEQNRPDFIIGISPVIRNDSLGYASSKIGKDYTWFSPYYVYMNHDIHLPPSLLISGETDRHIRFSDLEDIYNEAQKKKDKSTLVKINGAGHSMQRYYSNIYHRIFPHITEFLLENKITINKKVLNAYKAKDTKFDTLNFFTESYPFKN